VISLNSEDVSLLFIETNLDNGNLQQILLVKNKIFASCVIIITAFMENFSVVHGKCYCCLWQFPVLFVVNFNVLRSKCQTASGYFKWHQQFYAG